jgi:hypothetical protein
MKPIGSAQGKGIFLFTRLSEISEWKYDFKSRGAGASDKDKEAAKDVEAYIVQVGWSVSPCQVPGWLVSPAPCPSRGSCVCRVSQMAVRRGTSLIRT